MRSRFAVPILAVLAWLGGCDNSMVAMPDNSTLAEKAAFDTARKVDHARGRIWRLTDSGVSLRDARGPRTVVFDLPGWIVAGPTDACMPDLALGPRGEVVVTSNVIPTLWRIDPETLAITVHPVALDAENGRDVGFNALVFSASHGAFFAASHAHNAVWKINTSLTRGEKILAAGQSAQSLERSLTCAIN